jgi:hypothetical protein
VADSRMNLIWEIFHLREKNLFLKFSLLPFILFYKLSPNKAKTEFGGARIDQ